MPLWACSQYDVWHHHIWKPPFLSVHTTHYNPAFSKISSLEIVFENLWFWCPKPRLNAGRMAKTERKSSFSKTLGCAACVRTEHKQPQRRRQRERLKNNSLNKQNNKLFTLSGTFLCSADCTAATFLISSFMDDVLHMVNTAYDFSFHFLFWTFVMRRENSTWALTN